MAASPKACRIGPKTWKRNQKEIVMKIIVITGASSGFGALTARALAKAGHTVYASMRDTTGQNERKVEEVKKFAKENKVDLRSIELDVTSQASVDAAIQEIVDENKRLDVVIHNAGHMVFGPAEAFTPEQLAELYDINVLSTQRVNRAALPQLRKQRNGLLVWVSSSSSAGGTPPYLAPYFAAKAGMDALAVVYARELTRWGIETSIIVPGAFTGGTNHFANASSPADKERVAKYEAGPYKGFADDIMKGFASIVPPEADVSAVAEAIVKVVDTAFGKRPFRVHVDPTQDGAEVVNAVSDRVRAELLRRIGLGDLLTPRDVAGQSHSAA
jgi:NAD(P)-dependent dehydrogenase (short-subunit alcohol dehydrogenase family)